MVDITTSTTLHSSPTIPPTTSRHPRDPLRRLQHPPNVSTASSSSQLQKHFFNSSYFSPSLPHAHIRSRDTHLTISSTPGASPTSRRRPHELLRRGRAAAAPLLLQQLQQPVLDATDASSTPRVLPSLHCASTTSRQRQARRRAAAASSQRSRRQQRNHKQ